MSVPDNVNRNYEKKVRIKRNRTIKMNRKMELIGGLFWVIILYLLILMRKKFIVNCF